MNTASIILIVAIVVLIVPIYVFVLGMAWTLGKLKTQYKFFKGVTNEEKNEHRG